jgi:hypothetical protein
LVSPDGNAGLTAHHIHQDPNPLVWGDIFDFCNEIGKRAFGHGHLISGRQASWRQQCTAFVTALF